MADNYKPGDYYVIDDVTGFKVRASESRLQWNGAVVDKRNFEPRHPQDLIRSKRDSQNVVNPRPRSPDIFQGPLTTVISANQVAGGQTIKVESTVRMEAGDRLTIMLDNGDSFLCIIQSITDMEYLILTVPLPGPVSIGKQVIDNTAMAQADVG